MKKSFVLSFLLALGFGVGAQKQKAVPVPAAENTLLWRITGKGLERPSYLFGTMHMLCGDDITLSDSLRSAISGADNVYLELEMDNLFEMMGAMQNMAMKGDTTLADLLSKKEYDAVKRYFEENRSMFPFAMLETFKPMLAASLLGESQLRSDCSNLVAMESLIMSEAKQSGKKIKGLETMNYQLSIFDKIPYKLQAKQLYEMITKSSDTASDNDMAALTSVYRSQQLEKLEEMTKKEDMGIKNFTELLLYQRNENWTKRLTELMPGRSLVVAVGAAHLPGKRGMIALLRGEGYKLEPVRNDMTKRKLREL